MIYGTPDVADAEALGAMAAESFTTTFAHLYPPEDLRTFLAASYGPKGAMARDLADPTVLWRAAWDGDRLAGFVKASPLTLPVEKPEPDAWELRQLYVLPDWQGAGIARALTDWAIEQARHTGAPALYLSVYVDNHRAQRFYARYGFAEVGRYAFRVGNVIDDDRIWRLEL